MKMSSTKKNSGEMGGLDGENRPNKASRLVGWLEH